MILHSIRTSSIVGLILITLFVMGCSTAGKYRKEINETAYNIIEQKQMEALGHTEPFTIESPEEPLRKKLMLAFGLPYSHPASLSTEELEPIKHWPEDDFLKEKNDEPDVYDIDKPLKISLLEALKIAAENNRQYQSNKETVFLSALSLELQRDRFRYTFAGSMDSSITTDLGGNETSTTNLNTSDLSVSRQFLNGITITGLIGFDLLKLLNPFSETVYSSFGDASVAIPLLRGAGKHIVAEPLTQAERNTIYAIYNFERFKKSFVVAIASEYLGVLQAIDQIINAENNYRSSVTNTRLVRRLYDAGDRSQVEVDQAIQQELSSRNAWISTQFSYQRQLDSFKISLGIPPDAVIELDPEELERLAESAKSIIETENDDIIEEEVPPADAPVNLRDISEEGAGDMELEEEIAIKLALDNRLDLRVSQGSIFDAQREIVIAADALEAELTLLGNASIGDSDGIDLNVEKGRYNALINLDLPLERTQEIIAYRQSIINLERTVRDLQELEDSIKFSIRDHLRSLKNQRISMQIQAMAVQIAQRRVHSSNLFLQAGLSDTRDLLEAQNALLESQNRLTNALVEYRIAELQLQRDLGVLEVNEEGMWKEFSIEEINNG